MASPPLLPQLIATDGDAVRAASAQADELVLRAAELFAVVIVWDSPEAVTWLGWLTTIDHRALCFSAADADDPAFRRWLTALPGWDTERFAIALTTPGLHQVWRRSGP